MGATNEVGLGRDRKHTGRLWLASAALSLCSSILLLAKGLLMRPRHLWASGSEMLPFIIIIRAVMWDGWLEFPRC